MILGVALIPIHFVSPTLSFTPPKYIYFRPYFMGIQSFEIFFHENKVFLDILSEKLFWVLFYQNKII